MFIFRNFCPGQVSEGWVEVERCDGKIVTLPCSNCPWPVKEHRNSNAAPTHAAPTLQQRSIMRTGSNLAAIVAKKNHQRIVKRLRFFKRVNHPANASINRVHHRGVGPTFFVFNISKARQIFFPGFKRCVRCVVCEVQKERSVSVSCFLHKPDGLTRQSVGHVFRFFNLSAVVFQRDDVFIENLLARFRLSLIDGPVPLGEVHVTSTKEPVEIVEAAIIRMKR